MKHNHDFKYTPARLSESLQELMEGRSYSLPAERAEQILMASECHQKLLRTECLTAVMMYAAESHNALWKEKALGLWKRMHSLTAIRAFYQKWQEQFLSESFVLFCTELLKYEKSELKWVCQWKRWLTAIDVTRVVAGCAEAWCQEHNETYSAWMREYRIRSDSLLGEQIIQITGDKEGLSEMNEEKIVKVVVEYRVDGKIGKAIFENEEGITNLVTPQFPEDAVVTLTASDSKAYTICFGSLCSLKLGDASKLKKEERETAEILLDGWNYSYIIDQLHVTDKIPPSIRYSDATEHILLGYPLLKEEIINGSDSGLWSGSGERVLAVSVHAFPFTDPECEPGLEFHHCDDEELYSPTPKASIRKSSESLYLCSINTFDFDGYFDEMHEEDTENPKVKSTFKGDFSLSQMDPLGTKVTHQLPITLVINNTKFFDPKNKYLCVDRSSKVSIDFGTSSTCAAIRTNMISMIEMSMDDYGRSAYSVYENPTSLMMNNWKKFAQIWNNEDVQPVLRRYGAGAGEGYEAYSEELFDFGHPVKEMDISDQRSLDAVVQQLKMIPKMLEDGRRLIVRDYQNSDEVELKCGEKEEREFDPIEFYGYLLGKAINHPNGNRNRFYTNYLLSYPVKFSERTRKTIEESLKRGILRSLPKPVRNLKDAKNNSLFRVTMKYSEPIACVGAACGRELILENDQPCLFAVFDFGGGTADYSFGMYRSADTETEGYDEAIELFGVDGDETFGGELLINKISYWILTQNREKVIEEGIPFARPSDELIEDGFGSLILNTIDAYANIRKISEMISRPYFEGKAPMAQFESNEVFKENEETGRIDYMGSTSVTIDELFSNKTNEKVSNVNLSIDFEEINRKLMELFEQKCAAFSQSMENAFTLSDAVERMEKAGTSYNREKVQILMSGNSSRHPMVRESLKELFKDNNICLIGVKSDPSAGNHYKITPKTAVAIGALKLEQMLVNEPKNLSVVYVAAEIRSKLTILLKGDAQDTSWHRVGVVNGGLATVYCSPTPDVSNPLVWHDIALDFEESDETMVCFIRQAGRDKIEYVAVPIGVDPNTQDCAEDEIAVRALN